MFHCSIVNMKELEELINKIDLDKTISKNERLSIYVCILIVLIKYNEYKNNKVV